jgi:hypothetical protein
MLIWNIVLMRDRSYFGYQIQAVDAKEALEIATLIYKGIVVKVCLSDYEEND